MKMRKYIKYKLLGLAFIIIGMVACDQASQEPEPIGSPNGYPVSTVTPSVTSVVEGNSLIVNITIDKMIDRALTFTFKQTGGTATEEDYTVAPAVLQPYTKSIQMEIVTIEDFDTDATETLEGEIGVYGIAEKYMLNPSAENPVDVSFTITNFVSPDLEVAFYWHADVVIDGDTYDAADYIDFDFYIADAEGFDISDPWANAYVDYRAATGSHPEKINFEGYEDGTYVLFADLYYNDFVGASDGSVKIPIVATFTRQGTTVNETEVGMDPAEMMADNTAGYDNDPSGVYNAAIATVTIAAGKYTITKYDNTTIGPFKSGTPKTPRPLIFKTK